MAQITIEMVDKVLERVPYISYKEAKEALIKTDGDVLEAIILLEGEKETYREKFEKVEDKFSKDTEKLKVQLSELFKKATVVRVKIQKEDKNIINIPLTVGVIGVAAMPVLAVLGLSAAVLVNYSVIIVDENSGDEVDLGKLDQEKVALLKEIFLNSFEDIKSTFTKKSDVNDEDFEVDITDELFREEENKK